MREYIYTHTSSILKEIKINNANVGADASVCPNPTKEYPNIRRGTGHRAQEPAAITLVALIITVIILIILAGVSLNLALGENGIFQKSKEAVNKYQNAAKEEKEQLDLAARDLMLGDYVQKGLMLHYDAVKNTKNGHDKNATEWYDLSGNGRNGTLHEAIWTEDGLYFDGINDWVGIGQMDYENITIEAVVKYNKIAEGETYIVGNCQGGGYGLVVWNTKNAIISNINNEYDAAYGSNSQSNVKYSISGKYNQKEIALFENGKKDSKEKIGKITKTANNTIMALGANPTGNEVNDAYLNGTIYSVRIYNRALTDDEVMQNYKIDKMLYGVEDIN